MRQDRKTIEKPLLDYILKIAPQIADGLSGSQDPRLAVEFLAVVIMWEINELQGLAAGHTTSKPLPTNIEPKPIVLLDHPSNANPW